MSKEISTPSPASEGADHVLSAPSREQASPLHEHTCSSQEQELAPDPQRTPAVEDQDVDIFGDPAYQRRPGSPLVGVGPMPQPWPDDPRLDEKLLAHGDHRNVLDQYRYWSVEAIKAELDTRRSALHIAIENLEHDLNIGSIVRTSNAFNVGGIHIVGRRRWNKRGALVTDRYMDIHYHETPASLAQWAADAGYELVAIDNPPDSTRLEHTALPEKCLLVFGQESTGISPELQEVCGKAVRIEQYGSTRSMNVAAAAAIAIYTWATQHLS